jgi:protein-tyrosine phosphatase
VLNRYSLTFLLSSLALGRLALRDATANAWTLVLLYPSLSFLLLSLAYAGIGPDLLGKQRDGRRAWWAIAWSLPYSLLAECVWRLVILRGREPAIGHVTDNLYCGRRLTRREQAVFARHPIQGCLDLTAEFSEASYLRSLPHYRSAPILDGTAPTVEHLQELVDWLTTTTTSSPIYVHCALGHGRTSTVVVAFLIRNGFEQDIDSALSRLRALRSGVDINATQRELLNAYLVKQDQADP